jgi:hypothetical protein
MPSEAVEFDLRAAELYGPNDPRLRAAIEALEAKQRAEREAEAARVAARQAESPRSLAECRAALAQAITARDKAEQALAKERAAAAQAVTNEKAARERQAVCESTAAKMSADHIARCEQAARDGKPLPAPGSLHAAEVANATAVVGAAQTAAANFTDRVSDLERELRRAQDRVAAGVDDVIRATSVAQLVTQARALQDDLIGRRLGLYYLLHDGLIGDASERKAVADLLHDAALPQAVSINGRVIQSTGVQAPAHDGSEAWRAARAALARDADAALPI